MLQRRRSTKVVEPYADTKGLNWGEIKDLAKKAGISTHKKTRKQIEREIRGS